MKANYVDLTGRDDYPIIIIGKNTSPTYLTRDQAEDMLDELTEACGVLDIVGSAEVMSTEYQTKGDAQSTTGGGEV